MELIGIVMCPAPADSRDLEKITEDPVNESTEPKSVPKNTTLISEAEMLAILKKGVTTSKTSSSAVATEDPAIRHFEVLNGNFSSDARILLGLLLTYKTPNDERIGRHYLDVLSILEKECKQKKGSKLLLNKEAQKDDAKIRSIISDFLQYTYLTTLGNLADFWITPIRDFADAKKKITAIDSENLLSPYIEECQTEDGKNIVSIDNLLESGSLISCGVLAAVILSAIVTSRDLDDQKRAKAARQLKYLLYSLNDLNKLDYITRIALNSAGLSDDDHKIIMQSGISFEIFLLSSNIGYLLALSGSRCAEDSDKSASISEQILYLLKCLDMGHLKVEPFKMFSGEHSALLLKVVNEIPCFNGSWVANRLLNIEEDGSRFNLTEILAHEEKFNKLFPICPERLGIERDHDTGRNLYATLNLSPNAFRLSIIFQRIMASGISKFCRNESIVVFREAGENAPSLFLKNCPKWNFTLLSYEAMQSALCLFSYWCAVSFESEVARIIKKDALLNDEEHFATPRFSREEFIRCADDIVYHTGCRKVFGDEWLTKYGADLHDQVCTLRHSPYYWWNVAAIDSRGGDVQNDGYREILMIRFNEVRGNKNCNFVYRKIIIKLLGGSTTKSHFNSCLDSTQRKKVCYIQHVMQNDQCDKAVAYQKYLDHNFGTESISDYLIQETADNCTETEFTDAQIERTKRSLPPSEGGTMAKGNNKRIAVSRREKTKSKPSISKRILSFMLYIPLLLRLCIVYCVGIIIFCINIIMYAIITPVKLIVGKITEYFNKPERTHDEEKHTTMNVVVNADEKETDNSSDCQNEGVADTECHDTEAELLASNNEDLSVKEELYSRQ